MKEYCNDEIRIIWRPERCIHSRECIKGLPLVFDRNRRPWINLAGAEINEIMDVINRCPSGALSYERVNERQSAGGAEGIGETEEIEMKGEKLSALNSAGDEMGTKGSDESGGKNAAAGHEAEAGAEAEAAKTPCARIRLMKNGPLLVEGGCALEGSDGVEVKEKGPYALCRCGGSANKPFCDGTHMRNGFDETK